MDYTNKTEFISSVMKETGLNYKYIRAREGAIYVCFRYPRPDNPKKFSERCKTIHIAHAFNKESVIHALNLALEYREKLYYEIYNKSLNEILERLADAGTDKILPKLTRRNTVGCLLVSPHVFVKGYSEDPKIYCGYLVYLKRNSKQMKRVFFFGKHRSEEDAFISACKTSYDWQGLPHKTDEEYLKLRKPVDWEEKIKYRLKVRKKNNEKRLLKNK